MTELQIFEHAEFGSVRTTEINGKPYFVGKDVADILGYSNPRKAIGDHVDEEDKGVTKCDTLGGVQELTVINESGLYSLILSSKLPNAKKFKHWVTAEVLPSIRKHGAYMTEETLEKAITKLTEKDKEIVRLTYQLKAAENVINAIDNELSGNTSYSKERLPKGHTNMFMGMPYDLITDKASDQYALQKECITVTSTGIRMYDAGETGYYCAALGGAYGTDIGDTWHVTLKNGSEFDIILADYKHPIDNPDPMDFGDSCVNYISDDFCTNVIEFIYDKDRIPTKVMNVGTFSVLDFFGGIEGDGGDITEMKYTGRVWKR